MKEAGIVVSVSRVFGSECDVSCQEVTIGKEHSAGSVSVKGEFHDAQHRFHRMIPHDWLAINSVPTE